METVLLISLLAGALQAIGYWSYVKITTIEPNPVTWFMFAYGVAILTLLEWDMDAEFDLLILPTVCGLLAIWISYRCWKKARKLDPNKWWPSDWWPSDKWEQCSFVSDLIITAGYIAAWMLATYALVSEVQREWATLIFLLLSNLSTIPSFHPLLNGVWKNPKVEHWLPWTLWTVAYALLGVATYIKVEGDMFNPLMWYPIINAPLHAAVALLALRK
jgi:hypothetical protein